ncbi:hypothetical protein [Amycolatopsis methanolica]|uniref:Uncharacterized protein n=1 Tax=Amycolatopsis methanolica 239 TaxID=1068978 RepID=A0A076N6W7_AMYME|nr:hypothetical protein [Amycolatopsis methanolica]AIJ27061.1 hypothetical protein AMETH_6969 [Amycolatopsis methanolica 239]
MLLAGGLMFVLTLVYLVLCACTGRFRELKEELKNPAESEPGGVLKTEN